jgi:hypothetical protein
MAECYVRRVAPANSGSATVRLSWLNFAGVELSVSLGTLVDSTTPAAVWTRVVVRAQAPFGATFVRVEIGAGGHTAGSYDFDAVLLRRMGTGELIVDGTITAISLAANSVTAVQLAANSIVAGDLQADAVTAGTIAAAAISARELAVGAVTAQKIAAGAITSDKLVVGSVGAALNEDPGTLDPTAWSVFSGAAAQTPTASSPTGRAWHTSTSGFVVAVRNVPYDPARTYRARAWVWVGVGSNGTEYSFIDFRDANGVSLNPGGYWYFGADVNGGLQGLGWRLQETTFGANGIGFQSAPPIPAAARYISIGALLNYAGTTGDVYWADPRIEEVLPGVLIQNGAITTPKLVADAVTANILAANSVVAGDLTTDAVTAGTIAAAAITTRELAVGAVTAATIAAGAITVAKLSITDFNNLAENPNFELGAVGWSTDANRWAVVASPPNGYAGDNVMRYTSWPTGGDILRSVNAVTCAPGDWFLAECYMRRVGALGGSNQSASVYISWKNQAGAELSYSLGTPITNGNADSTWYRSFVRAQAPAGTAKCTVNVTANSTTGLVDVDAVLLRRMGTGELVVDGSIFATSLAANSVTAVQLAAASVVAGDLTADAVTAGTIAAAAISAREIAAGAIVAGKIAAGAVTSSTMAANSITGDRIAANTLDASKITASTITSSQIAAAGIVAGSLAVGAVNASAIIADAIVVKQKLAVAFLSEVSPNAGVIVNGRLQNVDNSTYLDLSVPFGSSLAGLPPSRVRSLRQRFGRLCGHGRQHRLYGARGALRRERDGRQRVSGWQLHGY